MTHGTRFTFFRGSRLSRPQILLQRSLGFVQLAIPQHALTYNGQPVSLGSQPVAALHTVSHAGGPLHQVCFVHSLKSAFIRQVLAVRKLFLMRFPLNLTSRFLIWSPFVRRMGLELMQATVCLRSAPASERAAAQPNSLTLQPARLIQVTPRVPDA